MIRLDGISKAYRAGSDWNHVLRNVSVTFPTGHSVGVLGLNGSGKSTLLRVIGGVEPPDHGTINKDVSLSWPIGFSGAFQGSLTGRENARFISRIYGISPGEVEDFAKDFSELGEYFELPVKTYSTGMRARLAFAISMAVDFDCYLVDEITAVGDFRFTKRCEDAFRERRQHASFIMVSHNPNTIKQTCDMAAILKDGQLQLYDTVAEAMAAYNRDKS